MCSFRWDLFVTIGVGYCPDDDEAKRRFRLIEAKLNKTFVHRNYHRLPEADRFWSIIVFEGERERGDRHCHLLLHVPPPKRGELSRDVLVGKLSLWIKILWRDLSEKPWVEPSDWSSFRLQFRYPAWFWNGPPSFYHNGYEWCERENKPPLDIGPCRERGPGYALGHATFREVPWSEWHFVTPPKCEEKFRNENLNVIDNRDRQKRRSLALPDRRKRRHRHIAKA
jgi:hypothetical protein